MNKKNHFSKFLALASAAFAAGLAPVSADPAEAEDIAYQMAKTYTDKSFNMTPTDQWGLAGSGYTTQFLLPVNRGVDYVFLTGTDSMAKDVDIYVYDEVGGLILDDRRRNRNAGVQFRSSYNGSVRVLLHMANAEGVASWSVLVGRRGSKNANVGGGSGGGGGGGNGGGVGSTNNTGPSNADTNASPATQSSGGSPSSPAGP